MSKDKLSALTQHHHGQYLIVTLCYWAFTVTDGALRMLVVLHFHNMGFSPIEVAMLFLLYEFCGVITNLFGGMLAARYGLNMTLHAGTLLQITALGMLLVDSSWLSVVYVMFAQALSGVAKDLNKMSAKSSVKMLVADDQQGKLYQWVAFLTGSKNTLKGVGFFLGGFLLSQIGFQATVVSMMALLMTSGTMALALLRGDMGVATYKPKFRDIFSKSRAINILALARLFLFASRDVWFVVAVPVFLQSQFGWSHTMIGTLMALWVIGYGFVQTQAPRITERKSHTGQASNDRVKVAGWAFFLGIIPLVLAVLLYQAEYINRLPALQGVPVEWVFVVGLMVFGAVFAINSSLHSYLIVSYARSDGASLDVGFYYTANAMGRLFGTLASGIVYQIWGVEACLMVSSALLLIAAVVSLGLPKLVESSN